LCLATLLEHNHERFIMNSTKPLPMCPACRKGHLHTIERTETFRPRDAEVRVELLASRCDSCGVETVRASQHNENLHRLAARKAQYGNLLMGEEIVALRKRYGLTQQAASRIFGKGLIAFSRYENEVSYPDDSTTLLLTMAIEKPDTMKWLADRAGVDLPLWTERCQDSRLSLKSVSGVSVHMAIKERSSYRAESVDQNRAGSSWQTILPTDRKSAETYKEQFVPSREAA
jgi:putative zinc finger/helix-turn-helix YgiT family protein